MKHIRFSYGAILILGVAYAVFQVISLPVTPFRLIDSTSYLNFLPIRSATYPLILRWIGPQLTMLAQPVVYATAATALSLCLMMIGRGAPLAFAVLICCFFNPEVNRCHAQIMTESLYLTAMLVFLVAVVGFFRQPGWPLAMITALVAGLAVTVRPTGYALLPVLILMVLMARRSYFQY